jgi:ABC-type glycerol-3-phosphate transport system substrate-binding protein
MPMTRRRLAVLFAATILALLPYGKALAQTTLTIATVNNGDMVVMQRLSPRFEQQHPDIRLRWVVLEENVLRQRLTTDIATKAGQFDILTIGNYEVPIWAKQGWLSVLENLPAEYDVNDILAPVRAGISHDGKLYALPFYAESAMTYYRTDLLQKAGVQMPAEPTYAQMVDAGFRSAFAEANGAEPDVTWPSGIKAPGQDVDGEPACLDYIWLRGAIEVEDCRLAFDRPAVDDPTLYPSDHLGLAAHLRIGG